jgi:class 3 adenylate cyclase
MPPKQVIREVKVSDEEDTREWAIERLKVLSRLSPWRLLRHFIATREPLDMDNYFDKFDCAALFIDISGFSMITEMLFKEYGLEGAEELAEHLNLNLGAICEHLTRAGGDIIKFAGDACMCVFAVENSLPAEVKRKQLAEKTLLATQLSLMCITELEARNYTVLGTRLTAHSGIGVGSVTGFLAGGTFKRSEYAIIGEPVSQIALAEPAAGNGETVISKECWDLISGVCDGTTKDADGNVLVHSIKPECQMKLPSPPGVSADIEGLKTKEDANLVAEEIKQVVPGQVRQKLAEFTPTSVPNTSEFRMVTVLFIRLLGLDYSNGDAELRKVQQTVRLIQDVIYKHEGCFSRFAVDDKGAVVLGVYGLPPTHHNDAERGCQAAMEFCAQIKEQKPGIRATVGITTGFAFSGLVGSQSNLSRCEYTTHGPLVNLAARLMVASQDGPLVDVATRDACRQVRAKLEWDEKEPIKVKGKEEKVSIFVPLIAKSNRLGAASSRQSMWDVSNIAKGVADGSSSPVAGKRRFSLAKKFLATRNRGFPRQIVVGRVDDVKIMREVFEPYLPKNTPMTSTGPTMTTLGGRRRNLGKKVAKMRSPNCVFIKGTSGVGKTELSREAINIAEELQMTVIQGAGDHVETKTSLFVFRDLMEALLDMEEEDLPPDWMDQNIKVGDFNTDARLEAVERIFIGEHDMMENLPLMHNILTSVKFIETADQDEHAFEKITDLIIYWIKEYVSDSPLCMILDNAQYYDAESWRLLEKIIAIERVVLVICMRPTHEVTLVSSRLANHAQSLEVELGPMSRSDIAKMFRVMWSAKSEWNLHGTPIVEVQNEIVDTIYSKAGGNPFHSMQLAENIKHLKDADGRPYMYVDPATAQCVLRAHVSLSDVKFPDGLHGLITQRIDLLPGQVRKLLKWMAVVGVKVNFSLLQAVVIHPEIMALEGRTGSTPRDGAQRSLLAACLPSTRSTATCFRVAIFCLASDCYLSWILQARKSATSWSNNWRY